MGWQFKEYSYMSFKWLLKFSLQLRSLLFNFNLFIILKVISKNSKRGIYSLKRSYYLLIFLLFWFWRMKRAILGTKYQWFSTQFYFSWIHVWVACWPNPLCFELIQPDRKTRIKEFNPREHIKYQGCICNLLKKPTKSSEGASANRFQNQHDLLLWCCSQWWNLLYRPLDKSRVEFFVTWDLNNN